MPRTRAAQRNAILEDLDDAAAVPLPSTPQRGDRAPLGEILLNEQEPAKVGLEVNQGKLEKGAQATKNKSAGHKKKTASKENARPESAAAVVEDDYESSTSSAVEEACQDLKDGSKYGTLKRCISPEHARLLTHAQQRIFAHLTWTEDLKLRLPKQSVQPGGSSRLNLRHPASTLKYTEPLNQQRSRTLWKIHLSQL